MCCQLLGIQHLEATAETQCASKETDPALNLKLVEGTRPPRIPMRVAASLEQVGAAQ